MGKTATRTGFRVVDITAIHENKSHADGNIRGILDLLRSIGNEKDGNGVPLNPVFNITFSVRKTTKDEWDKAKGLNRSVAEANLHLRHTIRVSATMPKEAAELYATSEKDGLKYRHFTDLYGVRVTMRTPTAKEWKTILVPGVSVPPKTSNPADGFRDIDEDPASKIPNIAEIIRKYKNTHDERATILVVFPTGGRFPVEGITKAFGKDAARGFSKNTATGVILFRYLTSTDVHKRIAEFPKAERINGIVYEDGVRMRPPKSLAVSGF